MDKIRGSYKNGFLTFIFVVILLSIFISTGYTEPLDNWHLRYDLYDAGYYSHYLHSVTYGKGTFVAVGGSYSDGIITTSSDGVTWTAITGTFLGLNAVAYGNGTFVAVGNHGTILLSSDGVTWTTRTPYSGTTNDLQGIAYGNGTFVAVENYIGYRVVHTSPDGYTWTAKTFEPNFFTSYPYGICYSNGTFVVVGVMGDIYTSPDGKNWTERNSGTSRSLFGVARGNGIFVAVGDDGTVVTSPDGATWTVRNSGNNSKFNAVAYGDGNFVAVGGLSYSVIFTSTDGIAWIERTSASSYSALYGVTYGNSTFIAVWGDIIQSDPPTPNAPSSLTAKATSSSSIFLSWKDNSSDEAGFKIERKEGWCGSTNEWSQVKMVGKNAKTYTNIGLIANTTYSYRVMAYNTGGNSAYSNCASAKTALSGTPKAPTNLNATSISANQIKLIWTDNSANETSFKVYRKVGLGSWSLLTTKGADIVSHTNGTASGNTSTMTYSYYLQACNSNGCSPASNSAIVPFKPTNLTATAVSSSRINLTWADKSSNETGFEIEKKSGGCSSTNLWSRIATVGKNIKSYSNTGQSSAKTYSYRVRAYYRSSSQPYAYGYSLYSNCSSAITP